MSVTSTRPRVGRPPKIDRDDIVRAAAALADEHGLEAVSIRAVAARVGVAPMTLYGHVAGADELIDLVVGATIARTVGHRRSGELDGRSALLAFAHGLRGMFAAHPAVLEAYRRRPIQDPTAVAVAAGIMSALVADGLSEDDALVAYATVYAFVVGFASLELRSAPVDAAALERHPTLAPLRDRLSALFDPVAFDRGVLALVDTALIDADLIDADLMGEAVIDAATDEGDDR